MINEFHEFAIQSAYHSKWCAMLSSELRTMKENGREFNRHLLTQCQQIFERDWNSNESEESMRKSIGNVIFIGELSTCMTC